MSRSESNWYVLTGRPCSGITTTLAALKSHGFRVSPEAAREYIDAQRALGHSVEDIRKDEVTFQREILRAKIRRENALPKGEVIFFDRGIPDSVSYYKLYGVDPTEAIEACRRNLYQKIFFLEPLPYVQDYARIEDETTLAKLGSMLRQAYVDLGYLVIPVPVVPLEERVQFIRGHM